MASKCARRSTFDLLPDEAQEDNLWVIGELSGGSRTQADILSELNDRLALKGIAPISASAFNRRAIKLRAVQARLNEARRIVSTLPQPWLSGG